MPPSFFEDEDYLDLLVALLVKDIKSLREVSHLLRAEDFKPIKGTKSPNSHARWVVAERALKFFTDHQSPVNKLLMADVLEYAHSIGMGDRQCLQLKEYCLKIKKLKVVAPDAILGKVQRYKGEKLKAEAIEELAELHSTGSLNDEKWYEISQRVLSKDQGLTHTSDFFKTYKERARKRSLEADNPSLTAPAFLIYPLDTVVRGIGRGQLGVAVAPPKRGKSLFLLWLAAVFCLQRLNGIFFTLEDPKDLVEQRLDAAISNMAFHSLAERPKTFKRKFQRFKRLIRTKLKIVDGTDKGVSVAQIEKLVQLERDQGNPVDFVIVDYDDEIEAPRKQKERRFEFSDIYRDLRRLAARTNTIVWTAAQTNRGTENLKILTGDKLAEDFSKARKATMAISLGQGEWGEDSIYLFVIYHKFDRMRVGCNIMTNKRKMLIYDRDLTEKALAKQNMESDDEEVDAV